MKKVIYLILSLIICLTFSKCWKYSFTNSIDIGDAKTVQVDFFSNEAQLIEPSLSQRLTEEMKDLFLKQTPLIPTNTNGDLHFEGEIVDYRIQPINATAQQTAAQNRLTITINVRYYNRFKEKDNFEKRFSFYSDFNASSQLRGTILENALDEILDRINQDIFNASVGNWKQ